MTNSVTHHSHFIIHFCNNIWHYWIKIISFLQSHIICSCSAQNYRLTPGFFFPITSKGQITYIYLNYMDILHLLLYEHCKFIQMTMICPIIIHNLSYLYAWICQMMNESTYKQFVIKQIFSYWLLKLFLQLLFFI